MRGHTPEDDPGGVARALVEAYVSDDYATAITYCAPDLVYRIEGVQVVEGHEGLGHLMEFNAEIASEVRVEFHHVLGSGETAAINRTTSFVVGGERIVVEVGSFFTVRHGLVVEWIDYQDMQNLERALGH